MTKDDFLVSFKYSVLQHARKHNNVTYSCREFNISRTVYYKWLKGFSKLGYLGLQNREKAKPRMPNRIKPDKEKILLNYIIEYPTHGPKRIANELGQQEIKISDTGVYNVLKRKSLNRRLDRLFYAQEKSDNPVVTERYLREIEKRQKVPISAYYPGYLFCQDTFYVGTIKGLGRIYQQTGIDAYAGFGFAKIYTDKTALSAIHFLKTKVLPVYRQFNIPLDRILTDNGKEYTTHWVNGKHEFEKYLETQGIRHTRIKPRTPQSNGIVERFNRTLLEEFYQIAMMKKVYSSLSELQDALDQFITDYNFKRTNQGYRLKGKIPYQKFLNGKRKYTLPLPL
ncbi:MAG: IS481 family transposase [Candidatus Atribacteria bacterium]|nr:IS481 family transposase [Candidatus Atribacteria bacterium]